MNKVTNRSVASTLLIGAGMTALPALAQDNNEVIEEVIAVGTRTVGRVATDSPVPVDAFNADSFDRTGATEVGRALQLLAPSFNFSSSTISDGTDALRPATLRGLGPDQTLGWVKGKRRHGSALVHVNGSVGRGTAGTDLNAIPMSAIERIEVLRDGAAAQYGSDAIAGVINIVLKTRDEGAELSASAGEYSEGDGENTLVSYNQGLRIGSGGFLNFDVEYRDRGPTNRAGLNGNCLYNHISPCVDLGNGVRQTTEPREINANRNNFRIGDADSQHLSATVNLGVPLSDGKEFYAFGTFSDRDNLSGGFFREPDSAGDNPIFQFDGVTPVNGGEAFIPDGFSPSINTQIDDLSFNAGVTGETAGGWDWDASFGYADNDFSFTIENSINASLVSATGSSPRSAFAGELGLGLMTLDFDMVKQQDWGSLAWGVAYREDTYEISPGQEESYRDYDANPDGSPFNPAFNGDAGIEVFPGFSPANAVDEDRDALSIYIDAEYDASDNLLLSAALRAEDYSDFGSTANAKGSFAYNASDTVMIRGAVSTGFRAPSLQQQFFNNTSTQFQGGVAVQIGTFRTDSALAQAIGVPRLEEETSTNLSVGVVLQPSDAWTISLDYYDIQIDDRIVYSGDFSPGLDPALDAALLAAGANRAKFFLNAADTSTTGFDVVANYTTPLGPGDLDLSIGANFTETDIDAVNVPSSLSAIPNVENVVFPGFDRSILTEWQPEDRMTINGYYSQNNWDLNIAANRFGEYAVLDGGNRQVFGAKTLLDAQFRYHVNENVTLKIGGNNITDEVPDTNTVGQSRTGTIVDGAGST
ncbi:MAG: TonB-dependent receptor plug domain-containing protein, partial [Gammaproteobacteria bacterium]